MKPGTASRKRIKHLATAMNREVTLLVGDSSSCVDIEYATGFRPVDAVVFIKRAREKILVVPIMEAGRAAAEAPSCVVETPATLNLSGERRRRLSEWVLALLKREKISRVTVPPTFPHGVAVRLQQSGVKVRVSAEPLFPERAVKRPTEIENIRGAQQAAVIAMRVAMRRIAEAEVDASGCLVWKKHRLTADDIRRLINKTLVEHDCFARDIIVAPGLQAADPHARGEGPLRAGEAIVIDIFPQSLETGYWGDLTRTVVKGVPSAPVRAMYQAVRAAQEAALALLRPGVSGDTVHQAVEREFDRRGFRTDRGKSANAGFIHSTGHGVGLAIHEAPSLGPGGGRLRAGNVVTVEPGLYYPGIGGVRIEDTVVITQKGWSYLAPCEKRLELGACPLLPTVLRKP